ncbi:MAG: hypothetical protein BAJALOKI3v1_150065 [Promethearchaeota archaeon]|jgi:hypothetical protein|nr:MAG: hypothetical protein BAJALOKI3v1_150065 [Candidatus Lokiarchaeota archaeon]
MENRLLNQFESVISREWLTEEINEPFEPLTHRELFDLTYHTANNVGTRCVFMKLYQDFKKGSRAILYSKNKTFLSIENLDDQLNAVCYYNDDEHANRLTNTIFPLLQERKTRFNNKEKEIKTQLLKSILVERKIDECANLVMLKDINRKIYFAIGDARESAAVVPLFMEAEGSRLVQLALNKWMATAQNLPPEESFPEERVPGLLKNLMQIKRWVLNLISSYLDKEE